MNNPKDNKQELRKPTKLWVCLPDRGTSHIVEYDESVGGCVKHQVAGGCTIPMDSFNAILATQKKELLEGLLKKKQEYGNEIIWEAVPVEHLEKLLEEMS